MVFILRTPRRRSSSAAVKVPRRPGPGASSRATVARGKADARRARGHRPTAAHRRRPRDPPRPTRRPLDAELPSPVRPLEPEPAPGPPVIDLTLPLVHGSGIARIRPIHPLHHSASPPYSVPRCPSGGTKAGFLASLPAGDDLVAPSASVAPAEAVRRDRGTMPPRPLGAPGSACPRRYTERDQKHGLCLAGRTGGHRRPGLDRRLHRSGQRRRQPGRHFAGRSRLRRPRLLGRLGGYLVAPPPSRPSPTPVRATRRCRYGTSCTPPWAAPAPASPSPTSTAPDR